MYIHLLVWGNIGTLFPFNYTTVILFADFFFLFDNGVSSHCSTIGIGSLPSDFVVGLASSAWTKLAGWTLTYSLPCLTSTLLPSWPMMQPGPFRIIISFVVNFITIFEKWVVAASNLVSECPFDLLRAFSLNEGISGIVHCLQVFSHSDAWHFRLKSWRVIC